MSYVRAVRAVSLEKTDKFAQMELIEHPEFAGLDPFEYPTEAFSEIYKMLGVDMTFGQEVKKSR